MKKFLTVVKREYLQRVRAKMFIVSTVLLPAVMSLFVAVPAIIVSIKTPPMRVAVVDQTGRMYPQLRQALFGDESDQDAQNAGDAGTARRNLNRFVLEEVKDTNEPLDEIRSNLDERLRDRSLEGYLILEPDFFTTGKAEFINRIPGDMFSVQMLQSAINRAAREQRLIDARVDTKTRQDLLKQVQLQSIKTGTRGQEADTGSGFALVFGIGFVMYLAILMYGQIILGAVIEEKETRIAEILFSSVRPYALMMGKLVGVSLVALTQLTIWGLAFSLLALYGVGVLASQGLPANIPTLPFLHYIYFALFFLLGYFIYGTIYA